MEPGMFFYDTEGNGLGSDNHLRPIPLYRGMNMTIHGHDGVFEVEDWNYHHGQPDENPGLHITLKKVGV